jgi:transmembrane sensor
MKKQAKELFERYKTGNITPQERAELESWYNHQTQLNPALKDDHDFAAALNQLDRAFPFQSVAASAKPIKTDNRRWIAAAAAVIICLSAGIYLFNLKAESEETLQFANDVKPGGNKAFLTLADGSRISLTDALNGEVARQAGISITKTKNGELIYETGKAIGNSNQNSQVNTIETPRGGQYQVKLPDGTRVWLNASSSLKYPAVFAAHNRSVELKGEAYFEVAKDRKRPFKVKSGIQEIQVLGTHFNVNAYADEPAMKTTLLEGSVEIVRDKGTLNEKDIRLKPGEQAICTANNMSVRAADREEAVSWKNGYFKFNDENIESILKKVSRWYDVDIQYEGKMTGKIFNGKVSRYSNVSQVLQILQLTGAIHFKIEGRRIIAMP